MRVIGQMLGKLTLLLERAFYTMAVIWGMMAA